jgi:tRNA(Ser,Leu) C12 N-acetylase TAN1
MIQRPIIIPPATETSKQSLIKSEEDHIFNDLKPVKFDGLYRKEMTSEEIEQEIKKLTQEEIATPMPKKFSSRTRLNTINDSAYHLSKLLNKIDYV